MARIRSEVDALTCVNAWLDDAEFDLPAPWVADPPYALIDVGISLQCIGNLLNAACIQAERGHSVLPGDVRVKAILTTLCTTLSVTPHGSGVMHADTLEDLAVALVAALNTNVDELITATKEALNPA